ncbi:lipopolysaccharide biosynthesis protein [Janthinobacterium sp. HLX7-2]|uniref:lipopolysaccharide biosynthesis protein n=1 Tax=Janthinobacterium sp. HLX7-2 TaxID=1259331 RepID=UPI003F27C6A8
MEKYSVTEEEASVHDENEFDVTEFIGVLWRSRALIVGSTVIITALCMSGAIFFDKYKSDGFLQFGGAIPERVPLKTKDPEPDPAPGIMLSDYKRYSAAFSTSERFSEYIKQKKLEAEPDVIALRKVFASRNGIGKIIEPVYPFTKLDAKELLNNAKEGDNNVIALQISYTADNADGAQHTVALLGKYAVDTIIYMIYSDMLRFKSAELATKITKLDNTIIENKEKLALFRRKGVNLKKIVARYPDSSSQASRQLVSVTEETARYLSPATQLMTSEVESDEANEAIYKAKREQIQYGILSEYYDHAKMLVDSNKSGEMILQGLEPIKQSIFKDKDLKDETIKQVYNLITIENEKAINLYLNKTRFIAGPSYPEHRSTRLSIALGVSLLAGLFFSIGLALGRKWWRDNSLKLQG